jgi:hypothetical protein
MGSEGGGAERGERHRWRLGNIFNDECAELCRPTRLFPLQLREETKDAPVVIVFR